MRAKWVQADATYLRGLSGFRLVERALRELRGIEVAVSLVGGVLGQHAVHLRLEVICRHETVLQAHRQGSVSSLSHLQNNGHTAPCGG